MPKKEVPLNILAQYLPDGAYEPVMRYLNHYKVHLTIAKGRESLLGDYRHKVNTQNHRISVNGTLNKHAFLVTLLHELAHLLTFEQFGNKVYAHGKEWKHVFGQVLAEFLQHKIFPEDVEAEIKKTLKRPGASTCSDAGLQRVLRRYDPKKPNHFLIEELTPGAHFKTKDGRLFKIGNRRTKRYEALEVSTGRKYLFSPIYEVQVITQ